MSLSRLAPARVATVPPTCRIAEAARLMAMYSVGALVIVEAGATGPVGIVTDRDVVRKIGEGVDPGEATVASFVGGELVTAPVGTAPRELLARMRQHGIRRLPLVDEEGALAGLVSLDDLLIELGEELGEIAQVIRKEFGRESRVPEQAHRRTL